MAPTTDSRALEVALGIVQEAMTLAGEVQERCRDQLMVKSDLSPVTVADFAVQGLVAHRLATAFPGDVLVAEENAARLRCVDAASMRTMILAYARRLEPAFDIDGLLAAIDRGQGECGNRFWTLDPIDGTKGFVRGGQYVVALALVEHGRPVLGILASPRWAFASRDGLTIGEGWMTFARRGSGAYGTLVTDRRRVWGLRVSDVATPGNARLLRSFEDEHLDVRLFERIVALLGPAHPPVRMDSQAKHAVLAAGDADLMLRLPARRKYREKIWDQAAGTLIVEEAGGRVTDARGAPLDFSTGRTLTRNVGVVASNGQLHDVVLEAIARCQSELSSA